MRRVLMTLIFLTTLSSASTICKEFLRIAKESSDESIRVPDIQYSIYYDIEAVKYMKLYEICRKYGYKTIRGFLKPDKDKIIEELFK